MSSSSQRFINKTLHIAGSCSKDGNPDCIVYAHTFVRTLTRLLLAEGAHVVTTVDKIAAMNGEHIHIPIIFCWDILEEIHAYAKGLSFSRKTENIAIIITTEKSLRQILTDSPADKRVIWDELVTKHVVTVHRTPYGWNSGASRRVLKEKYSDAFIAMGGGEGVEHLKELYSSHGKPVLPLDIPVGSSSSDGRGGARFLYESFVGNPKEFIPNITDSQATQATTFIYEKWKNNPDGFAGAVVDFLSQVVSPQVFFIRLLNNTESDFPQVEKFFSDIVTPFVKSKGFTPKEMGKSKNKEPFLNLEIFHGINKSTVIVADLTGLRLNCFMELGYALGLGKRVILTAKTGTDLTLDSIQIPCFFWNPKISNQELVVGLTQFWDQNIDRKSLINQ